MSDVSPVTWSRAMTRTVVALCALALLGTSFLLSSEPVGATDYSGAISVSRSGQLGAESAMRDYDAALADIKRDLKATQKAYKKAKKKLPNAKKSRASAIALVRQRRANLAKAQAVYAAAVAEAEQPAPIPDPATEPSPEPSGPSLVKLQAKVKDARASLRAAEKRQRKATKHVKSVQRSIWSKKDRIARLKRQRKATISRRESAEAVLAAHITQMTELAAARVETQASVSYAYGTAFSWPALGRISQTYGCTGYPLNPRRGSCRHFHDGLDIVNSQGSAIRSVGVGVVAYVGWNPWDKGARAWIVVVVHPDGWVSRYGHLTPTKHVRAGELVHTGQVIGKMGNTGKSTGTHLHFELLRGKQDVNPLSYLPAGVVKIKIDKTTTKKGLAKAKKKARQAKKKAQAKRARQQAKAAAREAAALEVAALVAACEPVLRPEAEDAYEVSSMMDTFDTGACAAAALEPPVIGLPIPEALGEPSADPPGPIGRARLASAAETSTGSSASTAQLTQGVPLIPA